MFFLRKPGILLLYCLLEPMGSDTDWLKLFPITSVPAPVFRTAPSPNMPAPQVTVSPSGTLNVSVNPVITVKPQSLVLP